MGLSKCHATEGRRGPPSRPHFSAKPLDEDDHTLVIYRSLRRMYWRLHHQLRPVRSCGLSMGPMELPRR
jgi:hypothetical protein